MIRCPECGSENVQQMRSGKYVCPDCEIFFSAEDENSPEAMQVFFSYGHDVHSVVVHRLAEEIERQTSGRITVWIDTSKITRDSHWRSRIISGIQSSRHVMAFLSAHSARERGVCLDELAIALATKNGMIKTILLEQPSETFTPPSIVSEYQWGDMSDYGKYLVQGEEIFSEYISRHAAEIIKMLDDKDIRRYSREVSFLRRKLMLPEYSPASRFDLLLGKEMYGREWLTEKVEEWRTDPNASRILMIYGRPGSGKSMFSAHLQHYNPWIAAALPCDCQSDDLSSTDGIIAWLAYKLAMRLPDYRTRLMGLFSDPNFTIGSGKDRFTRLIADLLGKTTIDGGRDTMVILIDALDESGTDDLMIFVNEYLSGFAPWLRFLITARKEPRITEHFAGYPYIDLDEQSVRSSSDMMLYCCSVLDEKLSGYPEAERIKFYARLIEAAGSVFTYIGCVCENILSDLSAGMPIDLMEYPLPRGIYALFENTLDRKFRRPDEFGRIPDFKGFWRTPLGMIAAAKKPLPKSTLMKLMGWDADSYSDFIYPLSTLITESGGCLQSFHRSFNEWLDKTNTCYSCSMESGLSNLAGKCYEVYKSGIYNTDEFILLNLTSLLRDAGKTAEYDEVRRDHLLAEQLRLWCRRQHSSNHFREVIEVCGEMEKVLSYADAAYKNGLMLRYRAIFLEQKADALTELNNISEASGLYYRAYRISAELFEKYPDQLLHHEYMAVSLKKLADTAMKQNDFASAGELYSKALVINQALAEAFPYDTKHQQSFASAVEDMADAMTEMNRFDEALELYENALSIRRRLSDDDDSGHESLHRLSWVLHHIAQIYDMQNRRSDKMKIYLELLDMDRLLAEEHPENQEYCHTFSVTLTEIAIYLEEIGDTDKAFVMYSEALRIRNELSEKYPQNPRYQRDCASSLEDLALLMRSKNDIAGALEMFRKILTIKNSLAEKYPENLMYQRDLSVALVNAAGIYRAAGDPIKALEMNKKALRLTKSLAERFPDIAQYQDDLALAYFNLGNITGNPVYTEKAAAIARKNPDMPLSGRILSVLGEK